MTDAIDTEPAREKLTTPLGWIGAGRMGTAMAALLLRAGHRVTVYSRTPAHCAALVEQGAVASASPHACAHGSDIAFCCVSDDEALRAVALGPAGAIAAAPGVLVDTSTVSVECSAQIAAECERAGVPYLRMPVSGNAASAQRGEVTLLVSGPPEAWVRVRPIAVQFSVHQVYLGQGEEARVMKLVINALVVNLAQAMAEALTLGRKAGLEWETMLDTVAHSTLASPFLRAKVGLLKPRDFTPTMTARLILKDIDLMLAAGAGSGVSLPLTAVTRSLMSELVDAGMGEEDYMAAIKLAERRAGLAEPERPGRTQ